MRGGGPEQYAAPPVYCTWWLSCGSFSSSGAGGAAGTPVPLAAAAVAPAVAAVALVLAAVAPVAAPTPAAVALLSVVLISGSLHPCYTAAFISLFQLSPPTSLSSLPSFQPHISSLPTSIPTCPSPSLPPFYSPFPPLPPRPLTIPPLRPHSFLLAAIPTSSLPPPSTELCSADHREISRYAHAGAVVGGVLGPLERGGLLTVARAGHCPPTNCPDTPLAH